MASTTKALRSIPLAVAPAAPSGTTARAASAGVMYVNWTDRSSNETAFVVERSTAGGAFAVVEPRP